MIKGYQVLLVLSATLGIVAALLIVNFVNEFNRIWQIALGQAEKENMKPTALGGRFKVALLISLLPLIGVLISGLSVNKHKGARWSLSFNTLVSFFFVSFSGLA